MSILNRRITIAIGTTDPNILAGDIFQQLRAESTIRAGIVKAFANADALIHTFTIGDGIVVQNAPIPPEDVALAGVNLNTQLSLVDVGMQGDMLGWAVTNPGAAAVAIEYYILIS